MKRSESVAKQLERYGNTVVIHPKNGGTITCKAMIQPLTVRRTPDSENMGIVGGNHDNNSMLYIGPVSCRLDQFVYGTTVTDTDGVCYRITRAQCVFVGDAPVYVWAVLQEIAV